MEAIKIYVIVKILKLVSNIKYFIFCNSYVDDYFICDRAGDIEVTCERLSDKIYNVIIPVRDNNYIISELYF